MFSLTRSHGRGRRVLVVVGIVACDGIVVGRTSGLTAASSGRRVRILEFETGFEIGFAEDIVWCGGGRLIDREGELHAFNGARFGVLAGFATALAFYSALADEICGSVAFEIGRLEFLDAPALLSVELVAHIPGQLFEFTF